MNNNFLIFKALLERDLKVSFENIKGILIDAVINVICFVLIFAHFLPALGMDKAYSAPLFLGTNIITILSISYTRMIRIKSDMEFKGFIKYHFILPINKKWLLAEYIVAYIIDVTISVLPAIILGLILIDGAIIFKFNPISFFAIYLISLFFIANFFLFLSFAFNWFWLVNNTWERMLIPMIHLGSIYFVWNSLYTFSPLLGNLVLINPLTYIIEGFRSSLFGSEKFISIWICLLFLLITSSLFISLLWKAMKKRMDPV